MKKLFVFILVYSFCLSTCLAQKNDKIGFYIGGGYGDASLNADNYIYTSENNSRQPELNIRQQSDYVGPVYTIFAGYNFLAKEMKILGKAPTLVLGTQFGFADLGKHKIEIKYFSEDRITGYRHIEEIVIDLTFNAAFYFNNGFNVFTRLGVARLGGIYTQQGLRTSRQPDFSPALEKFCMVAYRSEFSFGLGYLLSDHINIFAQYTSINGNEPDTKDRFFSDQLGLPTELHSAGLFSAGLMIHL